MAKRRRSKATTATKTKASDKEKAVTSLNTKETSCKNANISGSQEIVDASPSGTKKPKLDLSQSPDAKKCKKYIPPFTGSQRVIRLRRGIVGNADKLEGKSNSQESKDGVQEVTFDGGKNSQDKSQQQGNVAMISTSNEEETEKIPSNEFVDSKQSNVEMEAESMEGEDYKTGKEKDTADKNLSACSSALKQTSTGKQIENSSSSNAHGVNENIVTPPKFGKEGHEDLVKQFPKLSGLAQQSFDLSEGNRRTRGQKGRNVSRNVVKNAISSVTRKLDMDAVIVDAQLSNVSSLQTLADTCAEKEYIDVVTVDSELKQHTTKKETRSKQKRLSRKRKDAGNKSINSQDLVEEETPGTNNNAVLVEHQDAIADLITDDSSKVSTCFTTLIENESTENLIEQKIQSLKETVQAELNSYYASKEAVSDRGKSSCPATMLQDNASLYEVQSSSHEIIKDKLSEMLLIVTETNELPLSHTKSENTERPSSENTERPSPENTERPSSENTERSSSENTERPSSENTDDKSLLDPANESIAVTCIELKSVESEKGKAGNDHSKCIEERHSNNWVGGEKDSQRLTENIALPVIPVDNDCVPKMKTSDKVEDAFSKTTESATVKENVSLKSFQAMPVDNECDSKIDPNKQLPAQVPEASDKVEDAFSKTTESATVKENVALKSFQAMPVDNECDSKVEDPNKQLPAHLPKTRDKVENVFSKRMGLATPSNKPGVDKNNDQEVPEKMTTSPTSRKERDTSDVLKNKNSQRSDVFSSSEVATAKFKSSEYSRADISENATREKEDGKGSCMKNTVDEFSMVKEFEALEELVPEDDMGLFDDVIMNQSKNTRVENELPEGDSTIEFLINELASLHCMVANYEQAVEEMKRQCKFNGKF